MQFLRKQTPWMYSGLGAFTMAGFLATVFTLRHIWKRRTAWIREKKDAQDSASRGASLVEDMVMHNTKGF